jgi:hypothetical protein
MCTVITSEQKGNPKIAKKNIKVYKTGKLKDGEFLANFRIFNYVHDITYTTEFTYSNGLQYELVCDLIESEYRSSMEKPQFVKQGYHAYSTLTRAMDSAQRGNDDLVVGLFVIPKGAQYYLNPAECIVSNQIIFNKFIK